MNTKPVITTTIKLGSELTKEELHTINEWRIKEFQSDTLWSQENQVSFYKDLIFLVKDDVQIIAFGRLRNIDVFLDNWSHPIWGLSTVISIIRQKGYGKLIMQFVTEYVDQHPKTLIGFCSDSLVPFYEKTGFSIIPHAKKRFIYMDENDQNIPGDYDNVIYLKSQRNSILISALIENSDKKIYHYKPHW